MKKSSDIDAAGWPPERLSECVTALLKHAGLAQTGAAELPNPAESSDLDRWMDMAARAFGCESQPATVAYRDLEAELSCLRPAIVRAGDLYFAVVGHCRGVLRVLDANAELVEISAKLVCEAIRRPAEGDRRRDVRRLLERCGIRDKRCDRAADFLVLEQLGQKPFSQCWVFRDSCAAPIVRWLRQAHAFRNGVALVLAHTAQYLVWLLSWAMLGSLSFAGHMDSGWLLGWSLLLATLIPCRVLAIWLQGQIAIGVGALLKRRLLAGALRLEPEEIRHRGIGSFLGQAFEADAIETLALGGGIAGLLATVDIFVSGFVLGRLAILLAAWFAVAGVLAWRFVHTYEQWTGIRLGLTQDLVECMVGHRTRLVQQAPDQWHVSEDEVLDSYYGASRRIDYIGALLLGLIPRGWLIAGLVCVAPGIIAGQTSSSQTAIALGGILLAWSAFDRLVTSFSEIAAAHVAWKRIQPLFHAAARPDLNGVVSGVSRSRESGEQVLEADRLTYRYRKNGSPVLESCNLVIRRGDRVLLEGPSGGGKTTLASLLSGARRPESGLVLAGGLDMQTLGRDGWRERVVSAPQFHENHILTETLAFNLLCGRRWPPPAGDMAEAEEVCKGLGLGDLLARMPSGLLQMVGEGGWQLSHGERSRIFIARALLQDPELIILDESFGALDPENLKTALEYTTQRADTLMVIAHP